MIPKCLAAVLPACLIAFVTVIHNPSAPVQDRTGIVAPDDRSLAEFAFLAGTWRGEMNGEFVEEVWTEPRGGAMIGMFRWLSATGQPRLYEMLAISREGDDVFLRLRHFNGAMIGWESEKDGPVVLKLSETGEKRVAFVNVSAEAGLERIAFHQPEDGRLGIDVEFRAGSGRPPLNFHMKKE